MHPGTVTEIDRLPLHVYANDGETESKPCAEILLSEDAAERLLEEGLIPLISFKDRDLARVARFQSIAPGVRRTGTPSPRRRRCRPYKDRSLQGAAVARSDR